MRAKDDPNLKENVFNAIRKNGLKNAILTTEKAVRYLNDFNPQEDVSKLEGAIQFWKNQREAFPT